MYWPLNLASQRLIQNISGFVREVGAKAQVGVGLFILNKVAFSILFRFLRRSDIVGHQYYKDKQDLSKCSSSREKHLLSKQF